ncbi:MAG: L-serine ammonia-lyase, partial [Saprospiraceae bacterium]|nr:L-serine ammonia-lyase [Saprospiraceae bacterium]
MEPISVFDMLKIGVGPSSSHTLGPWRAAERFCRELEASGRLERTRHLHVHLYGSLALTGKGHGTDVAVLLGLSGQDPVTMPLERVIDIPQAIVERRQLQVMDRHPVPFQP